LKFDLLISFAAAVIKSTIIHTIYIKTAFNSIIGKIFVFLVDYKH